MKNLFSTVTVLLYLFANKTTAQTKYDNLYLFDSLWNSTKDYQKTSFIVVANKLNDSLYINRYYTKTGCMLKWESFKDEDYNIPNGVFAYYNNMGLIDSTGKVVNGKKDDKWFYYNNDKVIYAKEYVNGKFLKTIDYLTNTITYNDGRQESLEKPKNQEDTTKKTDTITFKVVQSPAEFKGGIKGWMNYIQKNLKTPNRFTNIKLAGYKGTVIATFNINKEGYLSNIFIEKSVELSVDSEVIRVLLESPKWTPAVQNGREVIYRHKQSFTFSITDN